MELTAVAVGENLRSFRERRRQFSEWNYCRTANPVSTGESTMYSGSRGTKAGDCIQGAFSRWWERTYRAGGKPRCPGANVSSLLSWLIQAYKFTHVTVFFKNQTLNGS